MNAEAFLFPTIHEPFGIVALEAWASKIPVISSARGGLQYFLEHKKNSLIAAIDKPEDWANYIVDLNNTEKASLIETAYQQVVNSFSWENCAKSSKELYQGSRLSINQFDY